MKAKIKLLAVISLIAVLVSCIGTSTGPLQNQLAGSWRLVEIRVYENKSIYPDYTSITTYRMDMTYSVIRNNVIVEEGQYLLQTWEGGLIVTYKPSDMVWGIWIRGDKMYKGMPHVNGGSTFIYQKLNN